MLRKPLLTLSFLLMGYAAFSQTNYYYERYNVDTTTRYENNFKAIISTPAQGSVIMSNGQTDRLSDSVQIPFAWTFYGKTITSFKASDNGYITFDKSASSSESFNGSLPDTFIAPRNAIFAFWTDLDLKPLDVAVPVGPAIKTFTFGTAPHRVFVIQWLFASPKGVNPTAQGGGWMSFAIRLYEEGGFDIIHVYNNMTNIKTKATIGVQNADGTIGMMVKGSPFLGYPDNEVIRFYEGNKAPDYDMEAVSLNMQTYFEVNQPVSYALTVHNLSDNNITSLDLNFLENGKIHTQTLSGLNIESNGGYATLSPATAWVPTSNGGTTFATWASSLNGSHADPTPNDDSISKYIYISNKLAPRQVLVEEFDNASVTAGASINPSLDAFVKQHDDSLNVVKYHVSISSGSYPDDMIIGEGNARANFYNGVTVPSALLDGIVFTSSPWNAHPLLITLPSIRGYLEARKGTFDIKIDPKKSGSDYTFTITTTSKIATQGSMNLYAAIVEDSVVYTSAPGAGGELVFHNVVRSMLPGANGTTLGKLTEGKSTQTTLTYTPATGLKPQNLKLVVWVQDPTTKEVQNSAETAPGLVSGIETPEHSIITSVYPNPARTSANVTFNLDNAAMVSAKLVDVTGREMMDISNGQMSAGQHIMNIDLSTMAKGVYFVRLNANGTTYTQKLVVE